MNNPISLPTRAELWGKAHALNEKTVAGLGFLLFVIVVCASIVARISLEANMRQKVDSLLPAVAAERSLVRGDILVPVTLSIKFEHGKATLRGTLPDENSHDTVLNRAREIYGSGNVQDNLRVEPGIVLTPWFDSVLKWFPPRIEQMRSGEISVNGMSVLIFGRVSDASAQRAVGSAVTQLAGPEARVFNDLQVVSVYSTPPATKEGKR